MIASWWSGASVCLLSDQSTVLDNSVVTCDFLRFDMTTKNGASKSSVVFAASFLFALLIAGQFAFSRAGHSAPVLIWCPNNQSDIVSPTQLNTAANPLQKLSTEDFEQTLYQLGKIIDLLIVSDELCVEDFKNNKVLSNATNVSKLHYLPCVDTPYSAFRKTSTYKQMKTIEDINDDHELSMALKDTDSSMSCVALTGKKCRYSYTERIKREALADNSTVQEFKIKTDKVLFYSSKPLLFKTDKTKDYVPLPETNIQASTRTDTDNTLILNIKFSNIDKIGDLVLEFFFPVKSMGYYTLEKVHYGIHDAIILETKRDIYFPYNFSYHCSLNTLFINGSTNLNITNMQIQIDSKDATFSDAYDCVGFTSIPIWTGIFVTAILAIIMIWALTMIMDIRTMDRFDDPKGKTITISAAE